MVDITGSLLRGMKAVLGYKLRVVALQLNMVAVANREGHSLGHFLEGPKVQDNFHHWKMREDLKLVRPRFEADCLMCHRSLQGLILHLCHHLCHCLCQLVD